MTVTEWLTLGVFVFASAAALATWYHAATARILLAILHDDDEAALYWAKKADRRKRIARWHPVVLAAAWLAERRER